MSGQMLKADGEDSFRFTSPDRLDTPTKTNGKQNEALQVNAASRPLIPRVDFFQPLTHQQPHSTCADSRTVSQHAEPAAGGA
jgi:hypothetical protein